MFESNEDFAIYTGKSTRWWVVKCRIKQVCSQIWV